MDREFNSSRLIAARQRLKMTKKQLATATGLTEKSITRYEQGNSPSEDAAVSLSRALNFPLSYFYGSEINIPNEKNASFRSFSRMTASQSASALAAGGFAFCLADWMERKFSLPELDLPDLAGVDPEAAADFLRVRWHLGVLPIKNMVHQLESKGVRVFSLVEDTREVNAFSSWCSGKTPFIFLNTFKSPESSRFDAAHELGHLVLHRHGEPKGKEVEAEANAFASAFLMPKPEMLALGHRCRMLEDVLVVKKRWNVSAMALVYRLHKVGAMNDYLYRSMCIEISAKGGRTTEIDSGVREQSLVIKKILDVLKSKGMSLHDIASEINLPADELYKLLFGLTPVSLAADSRVASVKSPPRRGHLSVVK